AGRAAADDAGGNFGRAHPNHELRYEIAEEFINVVRGLWDCWSDKAIIADLKTGKFFDESQVKPLNHEGPRFSVKGPINMGRCPQGQPLVLQAGGSDRGLNLAARTADVVFSVVQDFEEARVAYSDLKERVRRFGRDPDSVTILPGVMPIVGKTDAEARDVLNTLQSYVDSTEGLAMLSARLGTDMSKYPLDGPIPDAPGPRRITWVRPGNAIQGEAREHVAPRPLQPDRRGARTLGPLRFCPDDRGHVGKVVPGSRGG